jgi:hypothetical protein
MSVNDNNDNSVERNAQDERYSDSVDNSAERNAKDERYSNNSVYRYVKDPYNSDYGGNSDV